MINVIKDQGYQISFKFAISNKKDQSIRYVLVDDTDLASGKLYDSIMDIEEVAHNMQWVIDTWEGLLKTTGGAIHSDKLFIYPISFKFNAKREYRFESIEQLDI